MNINEIVGRLKAGGLDASSTNRGAAVYVTEARSGRAEPGWFGFRIVCDSEATERRVRAILSRWYDIDASGNVWRLRSKNRVPLMAIKRGGVPPTPPTPTDGPMYFEAAQSNSTVSMMSTLATAPNLEYSTDGEAWQEWHAIYDEEDVGGWLYDIITLGNIGDRVYIRGNNPEGVSGNYTRGIMSMFMLSGLLNSGGSITSLVDLNGVTLTTAPDYAFAYLFTFSAEDDDESSPLISLPTFGNITNVGDCSFGYYAYNQDRLNALPSMDLFTSVGEAAFAMAFGNCSSLSKASDMNNIAQFGEGSITMMYLNVSESVLIDNDQLLFGFPELPVNIGSTTVSSTAQLIDIMTKLQH